MKMPSVTSKMAASSAALANVGNSSSGATTDSTAGSANVNSELVQEMLMEKLRTKANSLRPLPDSVKTVRLCILVSKESFIQLSFNKFV